MTKTEATRERLKNAARRLFAERGVDSVSLRDIMTAAGQRNVGAIGYYFQNKDGLIRDIVADGASIIDGRRIAMLDELEARPEPLALRDVIEVIVRPSLKAEGDDIDETYTRFLSALRRFDEGLMLDVVERRWDIGYRRCIAHIRSMTPHLPRPLQSQRIAFMMQMLGAVLSTRELALDNPSRRNRGLWISDGLIDNLIGAIEGMLVHPAPSKSR